MNKGSGTSRRVYPLHLIVERMPDVILQNLLAYHALTGNDTNSKVGSKTSLMHDPDVFNKLNDFTNASSPEEIDFDSVESFLVKTIKKSAKVKTFDELRLQEINTYNKKLDLTKVPCSSSSLREHILRAYLDSQMGLTATLAHRPILDSVLQLGWRLVNGVLMPKLLPDGALARVRFF